MTEYLPCPFCGSVDLRELDVWITKDDGEYDVLAVECNQCSAQTPAIFWNERHEARNDTHNI